MRDLHDLVQQAASRHGLLTVNHLRAAGLDKNATARLVRDGTLLRVRRGLYRFAAVAASWEQDLMAACLTAGPKAVGSHRSALRLWGLRSVDDHLEISIRYPHDCRIGGVVVHRSIDLEPPDTTWIDGLPCTTPERTLCDAGLVLPEHEVGRLVDQALAFGIVTPTDLWRFRRRVGEHGRNGVGVLDRVLQELPCNLEQAESGPEIALRRLLEAYGLPPAVPQYPVVIRGRTYRFDLAYPEQLVAIEFDGFESHSSPSQFASDRRRQNLIVLDGWTVLRFSWRDLRERPEAVAREVASALRRPTADL